MKKATHKNQNQSHKNESVTHSEKRIFEILRTTARRYFEEI